MTYADRAYRRCYVGHRVVDCEASGYGTTRGVYVEVDGLVGGVGFKEEKLGYDRGGNRFIDGTVEADYTFLDKHC